MTEPNQNNQNAASQPKPWAKLTSFNVEYPNVALTKDSYTIGRNSTNDIQISDARLSGTHCKIYKDSEDNCWLEDLSSNGTFIDNQNLGKGNSRKLASGDKIYLLHQSKVKQNETIGYIFSVTMQEDSQRKRQREEDQKALIEEQRQKEKNLKFQEELGEEMRCCICIDYIYQCVTLIPCLHNFCAACFSDWMQKSHICPQCREEATELKKNHAVNNIIEKFMENNPDKKRPQKEYEEMDKKNKIKEDRFILKKPEPAPLNNNILGQSRGPQILPPADLLKLAEEMERDRERRRQGQMNRPTNLLNNNPPLPSLFNNNNLTMRDLAYNPPPYNPLDPLGTLNTMNTWNPMNPLGNASIFNTTAPINPFNQPPLFTNNNMLNPRPTMMNPLNNLNNLNNLTNNLLGLNNTNNLNTNLNNLNNQYPYGGGYYNGGGRYPGNQF